MPVTSAWTEVSVPLMDLWSMYMDQPRDYPDDHPLLVDCDTKRSYTFAQIRDRSIAFGKGLKHALKWAKGDVLAFFSPNSIDTPIVNLGLHWAGGVASPANPTYTVDELAQQLQDSRAKAIVTQKQFLEATRAAAQKAGLPLDRIFLLGDARDESGEHRHWTEIDASDAWIQPGKTAIDPEKDLAYLVYSSAQGTTGLPKGVMLSHYNMVANSYQSRRFDIKTLNWDLDSQIGVLPFFHIYGLGVVLNVTLCTGATCVIMPKFDLQKACQLIQDHRITFLYVPPPIVLALSKHPVVAEYDLSSVRWINSAAAPLSRDLVVAVWERLKIGVKQGYGLSETSPSVHTQLQDEWWRFQGSVGRLLPNIEAKIVDEGGKEVKQGEAGELLLRGPNIFQGYWNKPELNKETFTTDGWFRTGDLFYVCPRGNFYITDRLKELIKYKGFQVPPAELEAKLIGREDIADVCVVGVWDPEEHTETPRAYVVLRADVEQSDELAKDIVAWLGERVGPPKRLRGGVRFVKEIPKSQAGKILRRVLREQAKKDDGEPKAKL
ncbi:putative 4-coumarate--CoA ligase 1 [Tolypocladium ophioglossoides CBS 100239]|uniref:Putative 4-coumarate--CoA ligase 1 n=1 Tax=Tolypocladium ophioglossoides (strain CBS 100239) TaxID=1163406 RepID=A0A0L0NEM3_TOLOC|nr:putative 4-coumarate--CoA ligase 1 [Tolypocladium ophioglossoides CBS 100239]